MSRKDAEQWKKIIDEDLRHARRCLRSTCGHDDGFLRARIEENEAILARLAALERSAQMSEPSYAPLPVAC